jgi:hypothetical protein
LTRVEDKSFDCMTNLPEPARQTVVDFLTMSAQAERTPEALAEELIDSIGLKACLSATPRS